MIGLEFIGEIIKKNSEFYYSNTDGFRDYNVFKYWEKKKAARKTLTKPRD